MLIGGLPPEAALYRDQPERWTMQDEMSAAIIEVLDLWGRRWLTVMGAKQHELPDAIEIPRPTDTVKPKKHVETDPAKIREWFATRGR